MVLLHETSLVTTGQKVFLQCVVFCSEVKRYDGIPVLITLITQGQPDVIERAVTVLINMSTNELLFVDIVDLDVIPALIQALSSQLVLSVYLHFPIS